MATTISTNVSLIFANMIALEKLKAIQGKKDLIVYIASPWVSDVIFPMSEFGISDPSVGSTSSLTSEIIEEMTALDVDVKVCTLDYFSDVVKYKNPLEHLNPAERYEQAKRNSREIDLLSEFQSRGAMIYLNKAFHSKVIATSGAIYDGSFNFTLSGYYRNRENGTLISNSGSMITTYRQKLSEMISTFFREQHLATESILKAKYSENQRIRIETRENWETLMREYSEIKKRSIDREMSRTRGI